MRHEDGRPSDDLASRVQPSWCVCRPWRSGALLGQLWVLAMRAGRGGTLSRFAIGHAVRIIDHARPPYSPEEVVRRARSRLGSVLDPDRTVGVSSLAVECTIATGSGRDRPLEQADSRGHRRHRKHGKGAPRPSDAEIGGVVSARSGADGRQSEPHAGAVSAADERIHARHKCCALLRFYKE